MNIKFVPNLFLEVVELQRFKDSLDKQGFRKALLEDSERFGLIKNQKTDPSFLNGKVERDLDVSGDKTIKIAELFGIDQFGEFIYQPSQRSIVIPNDGNWYWVKVSWQKSTTEKGTFSISANGNLVGSLDAELTSIFRGQPNFPTRIKFDNSSDNTLEYDVLQVIDDQHAIIQHPALNQLGVSAFVPETDLTFSIVGTFTPGVSISGADKFPFEYDYAQLSLVQENSLNPNVRPSYVADTEFYLARVKVVSSNLVIQDKRIDYWESKGSRRAIDIERNPNPLIGVETIKYNSETTDAADNIVEMGWGMRSQNWSVDSSQNILTLFGSATGGKYKDPSDFQNGDFDGWRVYTQKNGKYSKVISSVKQGSAINLSLDVLDVDNYSPDGGNTFDSSNGAYVLVVPDADSIDIKFIPDPADNQPYMEKTFNFPINSLTGKCFVTVYKDPSVLFNVQYRYKSYKDFTEYRPIPSDTVHGYYAEESFFTTDGNFKPIVDRVIKTYTSSATAGFIELELAPFSLFYFKDLVFKGDIIGVKTTSSISAALIQLKVGVDKRYQYFVGNITLPTQDVYIALSKVDAVEGNEFRIHFNCASLNLNGYKIVLAQDNGNGTYTTLKTIQQGDVYMMKNIDGGIVFDCVFDDNGNWSVCYQNYELGRPGEIITLDGVIANLFDVSKMGKIKGLYGYALCDGTVAGSPDLRDRFIVGAGSNYAVGATGGQNTNTLVVANLPPHTHPITDDGAHNHTWTHNTSKAVAGVNKTIWQGGSDDTETTSTNGNHNHGGATGSTGSSLPIDNRPPYYALIYAKKMF